VIIWQNAKDCLKSMRRWGLNVVGQLIKKVRGHQPAELQPVEQHLKEGIQWHEEEVTAEKHAVQ